MHQANRNVAFWHMMSLLLLFLLPAGLQAQTIPTVDFPQPIQTDQHRPGDPLLLELAHPDLLYRGNEQFRLFAADGSQPGFSIACALSACLADSVPQLHDGPFAAEGIWSGLVKDPLLLQVKGKLIAGTYWVQVSSPEGKILHKRRLKVVPPPPVIEQIAFLDAAGNEQETLRLDPRKDAEGKLVLRGRHLRADYNASIQGFALDYQAGTAEEVHYRFHWNASCLDSLNYENPELQLEHPDWGSVRKAITLRGQQPVLEQPAVLYVRPEQLELPIKLRGTNLYRRAEVCVAPLAYGPQVLRTYGCQDNSKVKQGTLSTSLQLNLQPGFTTGGFKVKVRNRDGQESNWQQLQLKVLETTATVASYVQKRPLIEGLDARLLFTTTSNSHPFPTGKTDFVLEVNQQNVPLQVVHATENRLIADVHLPEGIGGTAAAFRLTQNGYLWQGFFDSVLPMPSVQLKPDTLRPGLEASLVVFPKIDGLRLSTAAEGIRITDTDLSDGQGSLQAEVHAAAGNPEVQLMLYDRLLQRITVPVRPYPNPRQSVRIAYRGGAQKLSDEVLVFSADSSITVLPEAEQGRLSVQLYKKDGSKLGEKQYVRSGELTRLQPKTYGLSGGNEFFIAFDTPDREPVTQRAYLRRQGIEQWVINVGISAAEITLGKPDEKVVEGVVEQAQRTTLLDGLNLGVFYLPELVKRETARPLGVGMNFILQKNAFRERVDGRIALSALLYEKVVLGLSFGQQRTALFLGANLNITSFGKVFTQ